MASDESGVDFGGGGGKKAVYSFPITALRQCAGVRILDATAEFPTGSADVRIAGVELLMRSFLENAPEVGVAVPAIGAPLEFPPLGRAPVVWKKMYYPVDAREKSRYEMVVKSTAGGAEQGQSG